MSRGTRGPRGPRGTLLAGVSLEIMGVEREAELLALLSAHLIPKRVLPPACSTAATRHHRAWSWPLPDLTWGPPSPLHPGVPGSGLVLPGGPWGAEMGAERASQHPMEPRGCEPITYHLAARAWGTLLPPGTPGTFPPLSEGRRKGFSNQAVGEGGSASPRLSRAVPYLPPPGPLLSGVAGGPRFTLGRREEAVAVPGPTWVSVPGWRGGHTGWLVQCATAQLTCSPSTPS